MNIETCLQMFILKSNVYKHVCKIVYVDQWCSTAAHMDPANSSSRMLHFTFVAIIHSL